MVANSSSSSSSSGKKVSLDRSYEENLAKTGSHQHIIGCDEAGRGPLAGPVTAAAVYVGPGTFLEGVMDSKALTTEVDREKAYNQITKHPNVLWSAIPAWRIIRRAFGPGRVRSSLPRCSLLLLRFSVSVS